MAGEPEEITMFPYQLSKVMADQRISDWIAAAERHSLIAAATQRSTGRTGLSTRLTGLMRQMLAPFRASQGTGARSTGTSARAGAPAVTSRSGAGPIGCSA
jgi:hypothetical protein